MSVCICMPARYNSKRLPAKLLAHFNDKTTIELTYKNVIKSKKVNINDIYIFYEKNDILSNHIKSFCKNCIETEYADCGTERIAKNLNKLPKKYDIISIIQCDEPFIDYKNIDFCIQNHINDTFFSTLHHQTRILPDNSSVKVVIDKNNNVLYYSRSNIPGFKKNIENKELIYNISTGIYVYSYKKLNEFINLENTPLYEIENIEQLKVLENGYKIKSFLAPFFIEISLDTQENYDYLVNKYC